MLSKVLYFLLVSSVFLSDVFTMDLNDYFFVIGLRGLASLLVCCVVVFARDGESKLFFILTLVSDLVLIKLSVADSG